MMFTITFSITYYNKYPVNITHHFSYHRPPTTSEDVAALIASHIIDGPLTDTSQFYQREDADYGTVLCIQRDYFVEKLGDFKYRKYTNILRGEHTDRHALAHTHTHTHTHTSHQAHEHIHTHTHTHTHIYIYIYTHTHTA